MKKYKLLLTVTDEEVKRGDAVVLENGVAKKAKPIKLKGGAAKKFKKFLDALYAQSDLVK